MKKRMFRLWAIVLVMGLIPQLSFGQTTAVGEHVDIVNGTIIWKGSPLDDNAIDQFVYLYNVNTGKFMTAGNSYGVQGSLSNVGMRVQIHKPSILKSCTNPTNSYDHSWVNNATYNVYNSNPHNSFTGGATVYTIETRIDNKIQGEYFSPNGQGADIYLDRMEYEIPYINNDASGYFNSHPYWKFEKITGEADDYNTYRIVNRNTKANWDERYSNNPQKYYVGSTDGSTVVFVGQNGSNNRWRIVTEEDYKRAMELLEWGQIDMNAFLKDAEFIRNNKDSVYWEWSAEYDAGTVTTDVDGNSKTLIKDGPYHKNNTLNTHWHQRGQQWMDNGIMASGMGGNEGSGKYFVAEIYNEINSLSQSMTITDQTNLKPGLYRITCQGFYYDDVNGTTNNSTDGVAAANFVITRKNRDGTTSTERTSLIPLNTISNNITPHSGLSAGEYLLNHPDDYVNVVFVEVKEGTTLTLSLEQNVETGWSVMDNFRFYACGVMAMYTDEQWLDNMHFDDIGDGSGEYTGEPFSAFEYGAKYEYPATLYLGRTFTLNEWNTLVLPLTISGSQARQVFGEDVQISILEGIDGTCIKFSEPINLWKDIKDGGGLIGGVPYIIKPTRAPELAKGNVKEVKVGNGTQHTITIPGPVYSVLGVTKNYTGLPTQVTLKSTKAVNSKTETGSYTTSGTGKTITIETEDWGTGINVGTYGIAMQGSYHKKTGGATAGQYIIKQGVMYHLETPKTVYGTYCKLWLIDQNGDPITSSASSAKSYTFQIGDAEDAETGVATEIKGLDFLDMAPDNGTIYNMNGQLIGKDVSLDNLQKGIYIMNGKKYVVK